MEILLYKLPLLFYFAGTVVYLLFFSIKKDSLSNIALGVTGIGFLFHTFILILRTVESGHLPLSNLSGALSFFSWGMILTYLVLEYWYRIHILGSFILPLAFLSLLSAAAFPNEIRSLQPDLNSSWFGIHTTLTVLGAVAFTIAFVAGMMYLIQEKLLKSKRFNRLYYKLPSLDLLDHLNQWSISVGFPLLTLGILAGALWAGDVWGAYWVWDPQRIFTSVTWLFYLGMIHGRLTVGWRGRKAAYLAIIGFMGVVFTFFIVNLLVEGPHRFI
ncbi:MAG: c-type cytochrome biogenesis protein CcsB [Nitrospirae bacterium]|nr:c-type cytochrome biogenesis protein CcsB [Nitrospirota bacterium]